MDRLRDDLPMLSNNIIVSRLSGFQSPRPFRSLSLKYVVRGTEHYTVNGQTYTLQAGEFLTANQAMQGALRIDVATPADGICVDIAPETMDAVYQYHLGQDPDSPVRAGFFGETSFFEQVFRDRHSHTGLLLRSLAARLERGNYRISDPQPELYFNLAQALLTDYLPLAAQLKQTRKQQPAVQKELLRRLLLGKRFLDDNLCTRGLIGKAAREACLSEYYFLRGFRDVFGHSPYQYVLKQRLQLARQWLNESGLSVGEIAARLEYPDSSAFSKAYKKRFGHPPKLGR